MLKVIFDKIFSLPPVEKRHMWLADGPLGFFFAEPTFRADMDDTYIYYLCGQWSFIISLGLALLNLVSHQFNMVFDFFLFKIDTIGDHFVEKFISSYTNYTVPILLILLLPFYLVQALRYIDIRNFDVLWWYTNINRVKKLTMWQLVLLGIFILIVCPIAMWRILDIPGLLMKSYHLENSFPFFIVLIFLVPFFLAVLNRSYLMGIISQIYRLYKGADWDPKSYRDNYNQGERP